MSLLEASGLEKSWNGETVFSGLDLKIEEGEKIGLVGPNGSGKSSLARIIAGHDEDYSGRVTRRPGLRVGYLSQRFERADAKTCVEVLLEPCFAVKGRLEAKAEALAGATDEDSSDRAAELAAYGDLLTEYEALGGDRAEELSRRILARSGLEAVADVATNLLSGGERSILSLAALLTGSPDLLVLDEPDNHLDFVGLAWLEEFIKRERRAILLVSHDRRLLDACADRIIELDGGSASHYTGNYSAYRLDKLARAAGQGERWQADRKRIERLESLVRRFAEIAAARPDPAWGARLRARRSQLEREKASAIERPRGEDARIKVAFSTHESRSDFAVIVEGYGKAWGDRLLFQDAGFLIRPGERAAIVGPNGSGKTSFLKDLVACCQEAPCLRWARGEPIRVNPGLTLGYCAQDMGTFRAGRSVGEEFEELGAKPNEAYRLLKLYLFDRSILGKEVSALSGGERSRLQIARAVFLGADFLVLDEPTNHLDIGSREALEEGLDNFAGTLLAASHDRWFLARSIGKIIAVEGGSFVEYDGGLSEYWPRASWSGSSPRKGIEGRAAAIAFSRGSQRDGAAAPDRAGIERRITSLELEKEELVQASARCASRRDFERAGKAAAKARRVSSTLEKLYAVWLSLSG
jgi:ATP-binding cassette subfamily F protein 3